MPVGRPPEPDCQRESWCHGEREPGPRAGKTGRRAGFRAEVVDLGVHENRAEDRGERRVACLVDGETYEGEREDGTREVSTPNQGAHDEQKDDGERRDREGVHEGCGASPDGEKLDDVPMDDVSRRVAAFQVPSNQVMETAAV